MVDLYSAPMAGAVVVPINIRWRRAEIEDSLHDCRASVLVVDKAFAAMGVELAPARVG